MEKKNIKRPNMLTEEEMATDFGVFEAFATASTISSTEK